MEPLALFVAVAVVLLAVAGAVWWFSADQRALRALAATQRERAQALRPGQRARVTGRVVCDRPVVAPLSHTRCAWAQVVVEEPHGSNSWRVAGTLVRSAPFWLDDGTGRVLVDPDGDAHLVVQREDPTRSGAFDDPDAREAAVLHELGLDPTTLLGLANRTFRYTERRLDQGELVSAAGVVQIREADGEPYLAVVAPDDGPVLVSDAPEAHAV